MVFDPDAPNAHAETRKAARAPRDDAETRAVERLAAVSLDGTLKAWDQGFATSVVAQFTRTGKLTDAQWKNVTRIARCAPLVKRAPASPLEEEAREVEAQLDELLRLPVESGGARCLAAVEEMEHRGERMAGVMHYADAPTGRVSGPMGLCSACVLSPVRACQRCARGEAHPGEPCDDPRRNRICKGWALRAHITAKIKDAQGKHEEAREIREDIGLQA